MKFKNNNQSGFTVVELLLIVLILAVIGFGGYYVWHTQHAKKISTVTTSNANNKTGSTTKTSTATSTTSSNPYSGWDTYTLQHEKLSFEYPSNWTLVDQSKAIEVSNQMPDEDAVFLSAPGTTATNATLTIQDAYNDGGDSYQILSSNAVPIKYVGANDYLVFSYGGHLDNTDSLGCAVLVTDPNNEYSAPKDIYVTDSSGDDSMLIDACTTPGSSYTTSTVSQAISDSVFKDDELIIESMHY